jgi:hypothetical protein
MTTLLNIWICSAVIVCVLHFGSALLIDGQIRMGLWAKMGLAFFALLGPLGVLLETMLIWHIVADIIKEAKPLKSARRKAKILRWINVRITERRYANLHG